MAREQEEYEEEEETEAEDDVDPAPARKPAKKVVAHSKPQIPVSELQQKILRIPVFESQAQQIFYDQLIAIVQKLNKIDQDLELMKSYLPKG